MSEQSPITQIEKKKTCGVGSFMIATLFALIGLAFPQDSKPAVPSTDSSKGLVAYCKALTLSLNTITGEYGMDMRSADYSDNLAFKPMRQGRYFERRTEILWQASYIVDDCRKRTRELLSHFPERTSEFIAPSSPDYPAAKKRIEEATLHLAGNMNRLWAAEKRSVEIVGDLLDLLEYSDFCWGGERGIFAFGDPEVGRKYNDLMKEMREVTQVIEKGYNENIYDFLEEIKPFSPLKPETHQQNEANGKASGTPPTLPKGSKPTDHSKGIAAYYKALTRSLDDINWKYDRQMRRIGAVGSFASKFHNTPLCFGEQRELLERSKLIDNDRRKHIKKLLSHFPDRTSEFIDPSSPDYPAVKKRIKAATLRVAEHIAHGWDAEDKCDPIEESIIDFLETRDSLWQVQKGEFVFYLREDNDKYNTFAGSHQALVQIMRRERNDMIYGFFEKMDPFMKNE